MPRIVIIGNGPAGVSAALYAVRGSMETVIIGKGDSALKRAHNIENYYGVGSVSGTELFYNGAKQVQELGAQWIDGEVVGLGYEEKLTVTVLIEGEVAEKKYAADAVIIATGTSRRTLGIKGISELEGQGVSYCALCDGFFFRGKKVGVLGDGQYALHEAKELLPIVGEVTLFTNGKEVVDVPEGIQVNSGVVKEISGDGKVEQIITEQEEIAIDGIFVAMGVADSFGLARKIGAEIRDNGLIVNENMETNIPGLYAAGDCTGGLLQIAKAVYEGAKAGSEAVKYVRETTKS